ncbi:MAG: DNA polymerase III subunit alpha [Parasporobacterium sp.]|nr:DNA polymerase III subunit alpha [Parasporobacterium sp.]
MAFTHLHVHTEFSLLDGSGKISEMISQAKALGMDSLAITDHGAMYGVIDFYKEAKAQGIKPIIGCEIYITNGSRFDRETSRGDDRYYHLVLLAETNQGYSNLVKIVSAGYTEGYYYKPRVDYEILERYHEGIIASSACLAGIIPRLILRNQYPQACEEALRLQRIFGRGNFFLELQDHGIPEQQTVNSALMRMSEELDIPLICTNDIHYTYDTDANAHDILLCIQTGKKQADEDRMRYEGGQYYMKSPEEMAALFSYARDALNNTHEIAQRCNVEIEFGVPKLPRFDVPDGFTAYEYLENLCEEGLRKRYPDYEAHEERLRFELKTIREMGYVDYFLIVWDFINYAKSHDIMVGPGRGSAAGSIVAYCLEITDIDPIKYSLIFERFLNPERVSMPDIDVDFCVERRGEVIDYVTRKYGKECVSQIVTFGTLKARNVIRDVGRVLDMPYGAVDSIAKMIPEELGITIDKALAASNDLRAAYETDSQIHTLIDMAKRLEGLPRHVSMHAAGVVISREPIVEYVPLARGTDGAVVTQYIMTTLEELGLLKMDFLGLRNLTVIQNAVRMISRNTGSYLDLSRIDLNDQAVLDMIGAGKTMGIFQLESPGMTRFMRELKPHSIEDIIAGIALYRPGPMDFIPRYIAGKNSEGEITYDCPQLKPILEPTYGCIVYQEQVMQIVRDLAGYTLGGSDVLRRAMSKKKDSVMQAERKRFVYGDVETGGTVPGCIRNGISESVANKIYDEMIDFAKYAFNKSHAAAYAVVSFQTAYLKYYHPVEYMAAMMTSVMGNMDKLKVYIQECKSMGIRILPPDINLAESGFSAHDDDIRYGLSAIKGVGRNLIDGIVLERETNGPYRNLQDLVERLIDKDVTKKTLENFIKAGALDSFGLTRKQMIQIYLEVVDNVSSDRKSSMSGQMSLFDIIDDSHKEQFRIRVPDVGEFDRKTLLDFEKEITGIYISGHPLEEDRDILEKNVTATSADFNIDEAGHVIIEDRAAAVIGGIIETVTPKNARNGQAMAFLTLEDLLGNVEVIVFPKDYAIYRSLIYPGNKVLIRGRATVGVEEKGKLIAEKILGFDQIEREIWIRFGSFADYKLQESYLTDLAGIGGLQGSARLAVYLADSRQVKYLRPEYSIRSGEDVLEMLRARFGAGNVKLNIRKLPG